MYNTRTLLISVLLLISSSCVRKRSTFARETKEINSEIFYSIKSTNKKTPQELLSLMVHGSNKAFGLGPIKESPAENELRIYSILPFGELFFRQQFKKQNITLEVYLCNSTKRGDSLFMKIQSSVKSEGIYNYDHSLDINFPSDSIVIDESGYNKYRADDISTFVIQIKHNSRAHFILIEDPFGVEHKNDVTKYVCNLIRSINHNFSFKFRDPWEKIMDSAFINPYGVLKNKVSSD